MSKKSNKHSARIYENDVLEALSRCPFWVPLVVYLPVIAYYLVTSFLSLVGQELTIGIIWGFAGFATWTLTEYLVHRFVFHYKPKSKAGERFIFMVHGVHHDHPNDLNRLVIPVSVTIPLSFLLYFLFKELPLGNEAYNAIFYAFFGLGYLCYDMIHFATHVVSGNGRLLGTLKKNHMSHHYVEADAKYGVSSGLWDLIFGSRGAK